MASRKSPRLDFHHTVTLQGLREYRCEICGTAIDRKEFHRKQSGVQEGGFYAIRYHAICGSISRYCMEHVGGYEDGCQIDPEEFHAQILPWLVSLGLAHGEAQACMIAASKYHKENRLK